MVTRLGSGISFGCGALIILSGGISRLVRETTDAQRILNKLIDESLDKFRSAVFPTVPKTEPTANNRVTVFKHVRWKWLVFRSIWPWGFWRGPASGWLVFVRRSGHTTQASSTVFLAPDDPEHAEGVAGRAWKGDASIRVRDLPVLSNVAYAGKMWKLYHWMRACFLRQPTQSWLRHLGNVSEVRKYCDSGNVSERWVWRKIKNKQGLPVSVLATPLDTADNERWGVLVIDSSNEFDCIGEDGEQFRRAFQNLRKQLRAYGLMR